MTRAMPSASRCWRTSSRTRASHATPHRSEARSAYAKASAKAARRRSPPDNCRSERAIKLPSGRRAWITRSMRSAALALAGALADLLFVFENLWIVHWILILHL